MDDLFATASQYFCFMSTLKIITFESMSKVVDGKVGSNYLKKILVSLKRTS